jgi:hypothetical protein
MIIVPTNRPSLFESYTKLPYREHSSGKNLFHASSSRNKTRKSCPWGIQWFYLLPLSSNFQPGYQSVLFSIYFSIVLPSYFSLLLLKSQRGMLDSHWSLFMACKWPTLCHEPMCSLICSHLLSFNACLGIAPPPLDKLN